MLCAMLKANSGSCVGGVAQKIRLMYHLTLIASLTAKISLPHTHPNTGDDYLQEPSETDKRAVRDDEDLKGEYYEGEFVISSKIIYLVTTTGSVREIGETAEILLVREI